MDFLLAPEMSEPSPRPSKSGVMRTLLLVALLVALGVAGWWTYTNYVGATEERKPDAATSSSEPPISKPAAQTAPPASDANTSQSSTPSNQSASSGEIAGNPSENAPKAVSPVAPLAKKTAPAKPKPETKASAPPKLEKKQIVPAKQSAAKREPIAPAAKPANPLTFGTDTGDAAFHKGEAFLYGRGVKENCDEAVKNLKAASAKANAKARSAFGTMYATGHCVARDLPTSYMWFALALHADPNNQILEKDLSAVWNQMTPPERQMATKMKQ
jgi:TPR repeat protein